MTKPAKKIIFKASQGLHKASLGINHVAVESDAKHIPKKTKEYLAEKLGEVVEFRNDPARDKHYDGEF